MKREPESTYQYGAGQVISSPSTSLSGLLVALVVARLARADDDVDRGDRDPRWHAHRDVLLLTGETGELAAGFRIGDDDEAMALAEAAARSAADDADDPVDHLASIGSGR